MSAMRRPRNPDDVLQYFRDYGARGGTIAGQEDDCGPYETEKRQESQ